MRHLQKSGIITLKALGGPIGSRTAQVQEAYEVHYSDGIRAAKKFSNERQAIQFAKDLIKSKKGLQFVDVFNAGSGFHSTADTDAIVAWWGDGSYTSNKSKHDSKLASKKIKESVTEGKKAFKINPPIGSSKYSISAHDGVSKHKDGSDFWDILIFKNKADLERRAKYFRGEKYIEENFENVANGLPQTMGKQKSLKREALKSIVREVMQEEAEYQKFFQKVLDKAGKSIPSMSDDEKKAFFNKVDAAWNGRGEKNESTIKEGIWPKSKLSGQFQMQLSLQLKKHFKGIFYSVGYDLYHNDKKILTIDGDEDSINSVVAKLKSKIR
jgi:hypothetical protein